MQKSFILFILAILLNGCNFSGFQSSEGSVQALFSKYNFSANDLNCPSNLTNNHEVCVFSAKNEEINSFTERLQLKEIENDNERFIYMSGISRCKKTSLSIKNSEVKGFRKPNKISLNNNLVIDNIILYYNPQTGDGCVEINYPATS